MHRAAVSVTSFSEPLPRTPVYGSESDTLVARLLLDAGPLGLVVHPRSQPGFMEWFAALRAREVPMIVPEIADYEVRRELIRMRRTKSLATLDRLCRELEYAPITTPIMRRAAALWAEARQQGRPTASDAALDADVILAATALELRAAGEDPLVITTNEAHLARYIAASTWQSAQV